MQPPQALFSMVFFDTKANENGSESIVVGRQWWLFPAVTVPLTIVVFATWVGWQRYRNRVDSESLGVSDLMKIAEPDPITEGLHNEIPMTESGMPRYIQKLTK